VPSTPEYRRASAELFLERLPYLRARAVEEHALVRLAELEQLADIVRLPALDVTEDDHLPLLGRQLFDRSFQRVERLAPGEMLGKSKLSRAFDEVFRTEGIRVIRTPVQAPNANAHAERWVRTVRADCLDRILILGRRHLEHVLRVYRQHYNEHRPHRALRLLPPDGRDPTPLEATARLRRSDLLGGLIHEYEAA